MNEVERQTDSSKDINDSPMCGMAKGRENYRTSKSRDSDYYGDEQIDHFIDEFFIWLWSKKTGPHEWLVALATVVLMFVACVQLAVSCSSSTQTDKLIDAANKNAASAQQFADAAKGINVGVGTAATQLSQQVEKLGQNVRQTGRLANETEKSNQHSIHSDRAWIGVVGEQITRFESEKPVEFSITIFNSGKTPAFDVNEGLIGGGIVGNRNSPSFIANHIEQNTRTIRLKPAAVIAPYATFRMTVNDPSAIISDKDFKQVQSGLYAYMILGKVDYIDSSKRPNG